MVEPLKRTIRSAGILVRIRSFPILKVERRLWERIKGVLGFGFFLGDKIDIVILFLCRLRFWLLLRLGCSRCSSGLGFLLLFRRRGILQSLFDILDRFEDIFQRRLVDDGLEMAEDVGDLCA